MNSYEYQEGQVVAMDSYEQRYGTIKQFVKLYGSSGFTGDGIPAILLEDGRLLVYSEFRPLTDSEIGPRT